MKKIDRKVEHALINLFPGANLEVLDGQLWIRTDAWKIDPPEFLSLQILGLSIASVMAEGGMLTLIISAKSTKTILR